MSTDLETACRERVLGLTGGIGCGKSTLGGILAEEGWGVVDSDLIARELMAPGRENWKNMVDGFGPEILNKDQSINRRVLGEMVFGDPAARSKLNELTHPSIRAAWNSQRDEFLLRQPTQPVVVVIPLLFEVGLEAEFGHIASVGCTEDTQWQRLRTREWPEEHIRQRMASQLPLAEKMQLSHTVFWNEGSVEQLRSQVRLFAAHWPRPMD
ncbi:MAG: dephospho-CoA kinase [Verrucomicrobiota bacterium]